MVSVREPSREPEYLPTPHEDSPQNEAPSPTDPRCAGNRPVRREISPVQFDMNEVFAILAEDDLDLSGAGSRETPASQESYSEREVSLMCQL